MSRNALICTVLSAALAAVFVAEQRVGLALSVVLLTTIAAGAVAAERVDRPVLLLAAVLALQPTLRDAGWVVAACVAAALVGGAAAVSRTQRWPAVGRTVLAPLRVLRGSAVVGRAVGRRVPTVATPQWVAVARGVGLAVALVACFGALFASADPAFADASSDLLDVGADPASIAWRVGLAALVAGVAGALVRAGAAPAVDDDASRSRRVPGRTELVIALGALVLLFVVFVAVQRPVLFGGAGHVRDTTGLGYGDYARSGFLQLVVVAALTLGLVGVAARRTDRAVRGLLGTLCVLTLVVLLSAHLRLQLVEDAYGLTRVRYGGHAVVLWLAVILCVVLLAGARPALARMAPRGALLLSLAGVLAFSLTNPDGRIAASAVERSRAGQPFDREYLQGLSADALHQLWRIPRKDGGAYIWTPIEQQLERPDGVAGFNVGRWTAR